MKRSFSTLMAVLAAGIGLLQPGCSSSPLTTTVTDPALLRGAKSILVRDFTTRNAKVEFDGNADSLGRVMAGYICAALRARQNTLTVVLDTTGPPDVDLVLEGSFTEILEGSAAGRILVGSGSATISVNGVMTSREGTPVFRFSKSKASAGGPIGMGGFLSGSGAAILDDNMQEIAEDLADFIVTSRK